MESIESIMRRAIGSNRFRIEGNYTAPRSFGVYRLTGQGDIGKKFRFGNHPVRMNELLRDYRACDIEGIFLDRSDAKTLASLLNSD